MIRTLLALTTISLAAPVNATDYVNNSLTCLTSNMHYEAAGEGSQGQIAVAHVTMTRYHYPNRPKTVCGVVYQPLQFSWTNSGKNAPVTSDAYRALAESVFFSEVDDPTNGADHYWACSGKQAIDTPYWYEGEPITRIGNHCFIKKGY